MSDRDLSACAARTPGWRVLHLGSKVLSPAAEAFRYYVIEQGAAFLQTQDGTPADTPA